MRKTLLGLWRVRVLSERLGAEVTRDVGVFTGSLVVLLITFVCVDWMPAREVRTLLAIGATWVALICGYEVAMGRLVFQFSWNEVVAEFNPLQGRLLSLGLAFLLFAPLLAARLRARIGATARHAEKRHA